MIVDLPDTTTSKISKRLVTVREEGGVVALGRVLTLIIAAAPGEAEEAIEAANDASREHPMRVIVVTADASGDVNRLDAQIRVGGDAGASEVVILRAYGEVAQDAAGLVTGLLLPDAPVVVWWPGSAPRVVADSPLGQIAQRRITDSASADDPLSFLARLSETYQPGDTDLAWTRVTLWRAQLAAVLDQPPYEPVLEAVVQGSTDSPSTALLAAWLQLELGVPVRYATTTPGTVPSGIHGVQLVRTSGVTELERSMTNMATLTQPGQPSHDLSLPRRNLRDCLAEELRSLAPDEAFGRVITQGIPALIANTATGSITLPTKG